MLGCALNFRDEDRVIGVADLDDNTFREAAEDAVRRIRAVEVRDASESELESELLGDEVIAEGTVGANSAVASAGGVGSRCGGEACRSASSAGVNDRKARGVAEPDPVGALGPSTG